MGGKRYYVVIVGRKPGVYTSWVEAAPHVLGIPKAVHQGYDSETEAYTAYGKATMAGQKRVVGSDNSCETPSQSAARVNQPERRYQTISASTNAEAEIKGDNPPEEIVVQCPAISSSRPRSTIQRASTLPHQQPPSSSSNPVQRSRTAPNLDSRSMPSTPKRKVHGQKPQASNISRSRAISISTNGSTTDDETVPSSPATNVSCTMSPTFGPNFPLSPRDTTPARCSPVRWGDQDDEGRTRPRCCGSGKYEDHCNHRTPTARSVRGSRVPARTISPSPSKRTANTSGTPVRSTSRRRTSRQHQPAKKVVWGPSSSTTQIGTVNPTSRTPHDRSGSHPPPSPGGTSQLTYVSDDERPVGGLAHLTGDSDYYTPSSRNSEMSDTDSEPPGRVSSSTSKRRGKRRASPPPPSSFPRQGSSVGGSPSASSLSIDPPPRNPKSVSGPSHKKRRDMYSCPPSPRNGVNRQEARDQTSERDPHQSLGQDVCRCAGPCPSCHKPKLPFPPQPHPMMFQTPYYPYSYFPPPHMQTGYPLSHYGPPSYPYPYAIPQHTDPIPSISSGQPPPPPSAYPMHAALATHPSTAHSLNDHVHAFPAPPPTSPTPASGPSTSTPVSSPLLLVGSPPVDPPATQQVPPEFLEALDQFYQPPQRPVKVIDPSCDPRSPYSKRAAVPAFPNSPIVSGRPGTPLSPLGGLGLAL